MVKMSYCSPFCRSPTEHGRFMSWRTHSTVPILLAAVCVLPLMFASFTALWLLQELFSAGSFLS